jgi:hypothetical protein
MSNNFIDQISISNQSDRRQHTRFLPCLPMSPSGTRGLFKAQGSLLLFFFLPLVHFVSQREPMGGGWLACKFPPRLYSLVFFTTLFALHAACFMLMSCLVYYLTLKTAAICSSETWVVSPDYTVLFPRRGNSSEYTRFTGRNLVID